MTEQDGEDQAFVDAISEWPDINDGPPLAGFLLARIAEDEALLKAWRGLPDYLQGRGDWQIREWESDESGGMSIPEARLAAECEAKRRIIDDHAPAPESGVGRELAFERIVRDGTVYGGGIVPACRRCVHAHGDMDCENEPYPCLTLRLLALPYADNPHYRDEWRP